MSKEVSFKNSLILSISLDTFYTNKNYVQVSSLKRLYCFISAI